MPHDKVEQIDEVKASMGVDASANDPVPAAGGNAKGKNRKADLNKSVDPKVDEIEDDVKTPQGKEKIVKAPARRADKAAVKEAVDEMFDGHELSEDFKTKATVVFEAVVNTKLDEEAEALEEEFQERLDEQTAVAVTELADRVSDYLDFVVEQWMEANEVAIDTGIKSEIAESLLGSLRDIFVEHNVEIPAESVDVVAEMSSELEETKTKLDEALNSAIDLRKTLEEADVEKTFAEMTEGLTDTQVEKLRKLSENVSYDDMDEYKNAVTILKESLFSGEKKEELSEGVDTGNQEIDGEVSKSATSLEPAMANYVDAIGRSLK